MSNINEMVCINRIRNLYETLTPREKLIAEYIMRESEEAASCSCEMLANRTGTSPASVVRFSKKIGFSSFVEMKMSLSNQWIDINGESANIEEDDTTAIVKQKVLIFNKNLIGSMAMTLDDVVLDQAVDMICNASRIMVLGEGGSGTAARNAYDVLLQLRLNCIYETDIFFQLTQLSQLGPNDLVLAFSNSGRTKNIYDNLVLAHHQNVPTIGVVGVPNTPISKYLDVELYTNYMKSTLFCDTVAVQICEMCTISVLHSLIMRRRNETDLFVGKKLGEAYDRKRIGWNE